MNFQEIVKLIQIGETVLNQINSNMSEVNNTILGLTDTMGVSEFYQAFQVNDQGYFRMQPGYSGRWVNVVQVNEARMMELQQQRDIQIKQLLGLQAKLMPILQQKNVYEQQGREFANSNMQNSSSPQQGTSYFGTMVQQPESYSQPVNSTVYQGENEYSNPGLKK